MEETNDQVKKWLTEHADQLEPEEIIPEAEKQKLLNGSWPQPSEVENLGVFAGIKNPDGFNEIIGNPDNWPVIRSRPNLFEKWVLPHAVLHFGKLWFDRVKRQASISRGVPFPLFSEEERHGNIENTPSGKAKIAKIVEKISVVLRTYLEGKWYDGTRKNPSGYIIESLRNKFVKELGVDMGYKFKVALACPYCLTSTPSAKVVLDSHPYRMYSCSRCEAAAKNLFLEVEALKEKNSPDLNRIKNMMERRKTFEKFLGITCICPSDDCAGRFVPLTCVDSSHLGKRYVKGALKNLSISKNTQIFRKPPPTLLDFPLTCPYCGTKFTPRKALRMASGFKGKSGHFTGLPSIRVWVKKEEAILDEPKMMRDGSFSGTSKDAIAATPDYSDNQIVIKQRLNLLIGEIIIHMSRANKNTVAGLSTWYFLLATLHWISKYPDDAHNYLFNWKEKERDLTELEKARYPGQTKRKMVTKTRGVEAAVHQAIFHEWLKVLEDNIAEFTELDRKIRSLKDFRWFARCPSFSGGPETIFYAVVDSGGKIPNQTPIRKRGSKKIPRLAKICSIRLDGKECIQDMESSEWQAIKLKPDAKLKAGDKVLVEALVMSSHPTHAPIQRVLRLRSMLLKDIINKILLEERTGQTNKEFWQIWKRRVKNARKKTGITFAL